MYSVMLNRPSGETRACIDGKQRLTSIHCFMLGEIPSTSCAFSIRWAIDTAQQVKQLSRYLTRAPMKTSEDAKDNMPFGIHAQEMKSECTLFTTFCLEPTYS